MITRLAAVRFKPTPPAFKPQSMTKQSGFSVKDFTALSLASKDMPPWNGVHPQPRSSQTLFITLIIPRNWVNTMIFAFESSWRHLSICKAAALVFALWRTTICQCMCSTKAAETGMLLTWSWELQPVHAVFCVFCRLLWHTCAKRDWRVAFWRREIVPRAPLCAIEINATLQALGAFVVSVHRSIPRKLVEAREAVNVIATRNMRLYGRILASSTHCTSLLWVLAGNFMPMDTTYRSFQRFQPTCHRHACFASTFGI